MPTPDAATLNLERSCEQLFGRPIAVAPRAVAALLEAGTRYQLFGSTILLATDFDCLRHVVSHSPACADVITRCGISLESLGAIPPSTGPSRIEIRNVTKLLHALFVARWPYPNGLTRVGDSVRRNGTLTEVDVFAGAVGGALEGLLPNETGRRLAAASGVLEDSFMDGPAEKLLDQIDRAAQSIIETDESHSAQQFVLFLDERGRLRVRPFGASGLGRIEESALPSGPFLIRGNIVEPVAQRTLFSDAAIEELEALINSPSASENEFQQLFEQWPALLTGLDYRRAHAQPILHKDDGGILIPDFFMEKVDGGWDAILDLKKPYEEMLSRRRNRVYFRRWIQEAIAQLEYYREWFDSPSNRKRFRETCGLAADTFRPRMIIVAGRKRHFLDDVERMRLVSNQRSDLELWTYDNLLDRAKRYRSWLSMRAASD